MIFERAKIPALVLLTSAFFLKCTSTIDYTEIVQRLQFKIGSISDFKIAGVSLKDKKSSDDLTDFEESKLSTAIAAKKLPSSFSIKVLVKDPNQGVKNISAVLKEFRWWLLIDSIEIASGDYKDEIEIKGDTVISLKVNFDFDRYFSEPDIKSLTDTVLSIYALKSNVIIKAAPVIGTNYGTLIREEILINAKEFR